MKRADLGSRAPNNPWSRQVDLPCDCESLHCASHEAGSCKTRATNLVRAFGMKQKLCENCLAVAKTKFPDQMEALRNWE